MYQVWTKKDRTDFGVDDFATGNRKEACDMSKVSELCPEKA